jgi:hypothetical protein
MYITLSDRYFVPCMTWDIISILCLTRWGFTYVFSNTRCYVYTDDVLYYTMDNMNMMYILNVHLSPSCYNITNKRLKVSHSDVVTH